MKLYQLCIALGCAGTFILGGCKSVDEYQEERINKTVMHFERSQYTNLPKDHILNLDQCVRMALKNNLELKVYGLEEKVAKEMRTSEVLGMLPELTVSDNFTHRTNTPASSSEQLHGSGNGTYSYAQSQDRTLNYLNVDLALSVLDFGLAFFNTQQANDRMLMRQQRTLRAKQNLILDTVRVYFQVAAAQRAIKVTTGLLAECKNRYELIEKMSEKGKITPFRAFDEIKRFVEMERRLTNYIRSYENSCVELRSLLGLYPSAEIKVDDSILNTVPDFKFPEMELMEQIALMKRPELYEIDMQKHINVIECRKTIISMFPNVRIFLDFTNSTNGFLYHNSWWELGVRAAYNLLKLPQQIARYKAFSSQVDAEEYRSYAQAIAVMAQVRIAHANLMATKERLDIDTRVNAAYRKNLEKAEGSKRIASDLSQLELDHMKLATAETEIEKLLTLGNYYVAYYRILNTLGIENLHKNTIEEQKRILEAERVRAAEELKKAKAEYEAECAKAECAKKAACPKAAKCDKKTVKCDKKVAPKAAPVKAAPAKKVAPKAAPVKAAPAKKAEAPKAAPVKAAPAKKAEAPKKANNNLRPISELSKF